MVYYENGDRLVTEAVMARLEPIWTVDIRLSDLDAEWVLACVELARASYPHSQAARIAHAIKFEIEKTRARRLRT